MAQQIPVSPEARLDAVEDGLNVVLADVAYQREAIVNVAFIGTPESWMLIDTGLPGAAGRIRAAAARRFGAGSRPRAILMTHAHFDHVGALETLAADWSVPVYAHPLERPYLDGTASYPPPDPHVGGGIMSTLSPLLPRGPVNVADRLRDLPADGTLPGLPGWTWLHTPGHSVGHVSFWRAADRVLLAGDAVITTAQESVYAAAVAAPELHGPPMYYTQDWPSARASAEKLAALEPEYLVTGHGHALAGAAMRSAFTALVRDFDRIARPADARYVQHPARAEDGSAYVKR